MHFSDAIGAITKAAPALLGVDGVVWRILDAGAAIPAQLLMASRLKE